MSGNTSPGESTIVAVSGASERFTAMLESGKISDQIRGWLMHADNGITSHENLALMAANEEEVKESILKPMLVDCTDLKW